MPRAVKKEYHFKGLAGCVVQSKNRQTQTMVSVYHSEQSGLENDPELPWVTVCEDHNYIVGHRSLSLAKEWLGFPATWCQECQKIYKEKA